MTRLILALLLLAVLGRWAPQTNAATPLDTYSQSGTTVNVYVAGVAAADVYQHLVANGLQPWVMLVRVDVVTSGLTMASVGGGSSVGADGTVTYFASPAAIQLNVNDWLAHPDYSLGHEYGHVWANYYEWTYWQGNLDAYLAARGLTGNPMLGSDSCWQPAELAAEDYRQLFAAPETTPGVLVVQCPPPNQLPAASTVPGLRDWLALTWTQNHPPPGYYTVPTATATPTNTATPTATATVGPPTPTYTPKPCRARWCR